MIECQKDSQTLCNLCQTREVECSTIWENVLTSQQTVEFERLNFFEILDQFKDICTFCFMMSFNSEYQDHHFKNCKKHKQVVSTYLSTLNDIKEWSLLTTDSCCFTCLLSTVMCYQTRDSNNNHCKYNHIVLSIIICAYYLLSDLNIHEVLSSFNTKNCHQRKIYLLLMLKKTRCFDTDAIVAIIFFHHVIEFCAWEWFDLQNI
jgi:hypothetical protein